VWQRICWLRSYKERAVRGLRNDMESSNAPDEYTTLSEPLLLSSSDKQLTSVSDEFEDPSELDYKLVGLWCVSLSCWLAMAAGVELVKVKYSGKWTEGMEYDEKTSSFYEISKGCFSEESNTIFSYFMICNWVLMAFVLPTLTLFTLGYLLLSKLSKSLYNERLYIKGFRVLRVLYPCSTHEPLFIGYILMMIEIERVTDPLLNGSESCEEEKCLTIKGQFSSGLLCIAIFAISMTLTYRLLLRNYNHMTYKL